VYDIRSIDKHSEGLQGEKRGPVFEIDYLKGEKQRIEAAIRTGKDLLQENLAQKLMILKLQRPDLFTISDREQIAKLVGEFLKWILA
jgi:hypothetical protein